MMGLAAYLGQIRLLQMVHQLSRLYQSCSAYVRARWVWEASVLKPRLVGVIPMKGHTNYRITFDSN